MSSVIPAQKRRWPHLPAILGFVAFFCWLFARFFLRPLYLAESDLYENGLPIFLSPIRLWSSYEFVGLPVLADPANFTFYPPSILFGQVLHSWTAVVMSAPLLASIFCYAYVFGLTGSRSAAVFAGLSYGLCEDMLERLRHINHVHAIAWLPLIVLSLDRLHARAGRTWIVVGAFAVGCCILAGHPQPAMYVMYCAGAYALVGLVVGRAGWRAAGAIAVMFTLGIMLAAVKEVPLAQASSLVARSEGLTFQRFVGPSLTGPQMLSFVYPTVLHGATTELPTYMGIATLLMALIGATRMRFDWRIAFWLLAAMLGVGMALGQATPLTDLAFYVPFYTWFRNLSRHLFLFAFGASVIAGVGVAALQRRQVTMRQAAYASLLLAFVMLVGALFLGMKPEWFPLEGPHGQPGPGPLSVLSLGVWIQIGVLAAVVALTVWIARTPSGFSLALLVVVLVADLVSALPYDVKRDGIEIYGIDGRNLAPSVHAQTIGRALEPLRQRVLSIGGTGSDVVVPATFARVWRIPIAGGYGAMLIDRLSRLAGMGTNGEIRPEVLAPSDATLDLLAVKYVVVNRDQMQNPARQRWLNDSRRWREVMNFSSARDTDRGVDESVFGETEVLVFENQRALPRAWVVGQIVVGDDALATSTIRSSTLPDGRTFDPRTTAIVDASAEPSVVQFSPGRVDARVLSIGDGEITLAVSTDGGGFLVLSENMYPGWRARVDRRETQIYRTDVTLQGIVLPPGMHRVEFSMESGALRAGMAVSGAAVLVSLLLLVQGIRGTPE